MADARTHDIDQNKVMKETIDKLKECLVTGYDDQDRLFFTSTKLELEEVLTQLDSARAEIKKQIESDS